MERKELKVPTQTLKALLELAEKSPAYTTHGSQWAVEAVMEARNILAVRFYNPPMKRATTA